MTHRRNETIISQGLPVFKERTSSGHFSYIPQEHPFDGG